MFYVFFESVNDRFLPGCLAQESMACLAMAPWKHCLAGTTLVVSYKGVFCLLFLFCVFFVKKHDMSGCFLFFSGCFSSIF